MDIYHLTEGDSSLIFSSPHTGTFVPANIKARFTPAALPLTDTDWHVNLLYEDFAAVTDATFIRANYSRYVVDLNRPPDNKPLYPGQTHVPLCPDKVFTGEDIYLPGQEPDEQEVASRVQQYWQPYHDALAAQIARVQAKHGYAVLYDCHSIYSNIPRLFEGRLPDLNLGTANGASCGKDIEKAAFEAAQQSPYSAVLNGRFIGGYITRHYGRPEQGVHAIQMEIVRDTHIDEETFSYNETRAAKLKPVLEFMLKNIMATSRSSFRRKPESIDRMDPGSGPG